MYYLVRVTTLSETHMTGSTHLDIETESSIISSTDRSEFSSVKLQDTLLTSSNVTTFIGPPQVEKAELISKNHLVVIFNTPIQGPDSCHDKAAKTGQRMRPRLLHQILSCCEQIFREPPFLNDYGM